MYYTLLHSMQIVMCLALQVPAVPACSGNASKLLRTEMSGNIAPVM